MEEIISTSTLWVLLGAVLVFVMQAGFCMLETGFTRAKNAGNIIMKNSLDFAIGSISYWLVGFGIMFGINNGFVGIFDLFTGQLGTGAYITPDGVAPSAWLIFQTVFCATAATIVAGAMAERTKFGAYCLYSAIISLAVYPVSGHWIWGGGWLAELGFHDFAGSTAVHFVGGLSALIGAAIIGPRIGKYTKGKPNAIPGHSLTLGALGVFLLWFGWFGFNGASTAAFDGDSVLLASDIFITTNLAAATGTLAAMLFTWARYKKPDISMTLNGALAGLVGITAGCDIVEPWAACVIGLVAGVIVVLGIEFVDKVLKIDDPVGAVGVHCFCGLFGTICVGLFATDGGLFYGGGAKLLGVQALGLLAVAVWVTVTMSLTFFCIKKTIGLRASREDEIQGLDTAEHGLESSYADFIPVTYAAETSSATTAIVNDTPYAPADGVKMNRISIITRTERFEALKNALTEVGITGMTVSNVNGFGMQSGNSEFYRGVEVKARLLPKIQVDVVVCKVPVETVVKAAKSALHTGQIGDGKIFVYNVENAVKIRTGEIGYEALQDDK
ncbi:MAG: ammonium transporter [Oscillospiraceae bacterium]|jgi:Amt family ammonium transporter|nr:ammonium transporter [Oscillospiraceae bacterium]